MGGNMKKLWISEFCLFLCSHVANDLFFGNLRSGVRPYEGEREIWILPAREKDKTSGNGSVDQEKRENDMGIRLSDDVQVL